MTRTLKSLLTALLFVLSVVVHSQSVFDEYKSLFTIPSSYVIAYTPTSPIIDGDLGDNQWKNVVWTDCFQDIEGDLKPNPYYDTRVKMLWDSSYLYVAAEMKEPHLWGNLTKRDQIVIYDNDFEIFIDPLNTTHNYFEIEVNTLNTIFDLFLSKPYRNGGSALFSWNTPGMLHAVKMYGSLNNPNDRDEGWTVEFAIPFSSLTLGNNVNIPQEGDIWRINFSRVQWETDVVNGEYVKRKDSQGKVLPENNWVWSSQGVIDMHRPERWGYLQFSTKSVNDKLPVFSLPYTEKQRKYLWLIYYKQKDFQRMNLRYASSLEELGLPKKVDIDGFENELVVEGTSLTFDALIKDVATGKLIRINNEGLITK